jgi:hypothetical protein
MKFWSEAVGLALLLVAGGASAGSTVVASELDSQCAPLELHKTSIFARHWLWSGIFPLEGGFIPDPHIICNPATAAAPSVARALGDSTLRFQLAFLNHFFDDESVLVIITSVRGTRAVRLDRPPDRTIPPGNGLPGLKNFALGGRVYLLVGEIGVKGLVRMPESAEDGSAPLLAPSSPEFESVLATLAVDPSAADVVADFCNPVEGTLASLTSVWLGGCPGLDFRAHFKREPRAMYNQLWLSGR